MEDEIYNQKLCCKDTFAHIKEFINSYKVNVIIDKFPSVMSIKIGPL